MNDWVAYSTPSKSRLISSSERFNAGMRVRREQHRQCLHVVSPSLAAVARNPIARPARSRCAPPRRISLVRHFNWVHLTGGAQLAIATRNAFSTSHPLFRLLWPYIFATQQSNDIVICGQMARGGDFETIFSFTFEGMCQLFDDSHLAYPHLVNDPEADGETSRHPRRRLRHPDTSQPRGGVRRLPRLRAELPGHLLSADIRYEHAFATKRRWPGSQNSTRACQTAWA